MLSFALVACSLAAPPSAARHDVHPTSPRIALLGKAAIPPDALDLSGLTNTIGSGVPHNHFGSWGSGIDYSGVGDVYLVCADRGPGDGSSAYRPRFHRIRIHITNASAESSALAHVSVSLLQTTIFTDEDGGPVWGYTGGFRPPPASAATHVRFDPESIRSVPSSNGSFLVSEEYGPWLDLFSADGRRLRRFAPPPQFQIDIPDGDPVVEQSLNSRGRVPNRGFEGLAVERGSTRAPSTGPIRAWTMVQSPLAQDAFTDAIGRRIGFHARMVEFTLDCDTPRPPRTREFVYRLDHPRNGVSEILHMDGDRLLVLERDSEAGWEARHRRIYIADLSGATDVSSCDALPPVTLPAEIAPAQKSLLIDLLDPALGLAAAEMPAKIEGLCWGPSVDGHRTLIVTTDNDFKPDEPTWVWVFSIAPNALTP